MKKIVISLILVCTLLITVLSPLHIFANEVSYNDADMEEYKTLAALGFVDELSDFSQIVTRGEAVKLISRIIPGDFTGAGKQYFKDIPPESEFFTSAWILAEMNIISGNGEGLFEPERAITPLEAVKMLVSCLGADYEALQKGGYPYGYLVSAQDKRIIPSNMNLSEELKIGDLIRMIYQTLHADINMSTVFDGKYTRGKESLMSKRFSIFCEKGIMTDNGITSLTGASAVKEGFVIIDNETYTSNGDYSNLLGYRTEIYYKNDNYGDRKLLYARMSENNDILTITDEQKPKFENFNYTYYEKIDLEKKKSVRIAQNYVLIYNNMAVSDGEFFSESLLCPAMGDIELTDNNGDGIYDIVKIKDYVDVQVVGADSNNLTIYDKNGNNLYLDKPKAVYDISYANGSKATFVAASAPDTLLTVMQSADKLHISIVISAEMTRGVLKEIDDEYVTIGDREYKFSPYYNDTAEVGKEYDCYINTRGLIAYVKEVTDSESKLAYLVNVSGENGLSSRSVKLFTEEYGMIAAEFAQSVYISDKKKISSEKAAEFFLVTDEESGTKTVKKCMVRYKMNSENKITSIIPLDEYVLFEKISAKTHGRLNLIIDTSDTSGTINTRQFPYDTNAKVFTVGADDDSYSVKEASDLPEYVSPVYKMSAFATNSTYPYIADVMVIHSDGDVGADDYNVDDSPLSSHSEGAHGVIVESITNVLFDDDAVYRVNVRFGTQRSYFMAETLEALKFNASSGRYIENGDNGETVAPGDIIKYGKNLNGFVSAGNLLVVYDENRGVYRDFTDGPYAASYSYTNRSPGGYYTLLPAYAYDICKDFYIFYDTPIIGDTLPENSHRFMRKLTGAMQVIVFDRKTKKLSVGNPNDILVYKSVGKDYSMGILYNYENTADGYKLYLYR